MKSKKNKIPKYTERGFIAKLLMTLFYFVKDIRQPRGFDEFGLTMYCGRQGAGKTVAMTEYLIRMKQKYPNALILTNYNFVGQDMPMTDWKDFFNVRNGTDGVIFAIDEIQNEFSSTAWKNFPESLLSEITQQRKQRVKIVASSQVFTRVVKPLREQCNEVVECRTFLKRWTFMKCFDAVEYNDAIDSITLKKKRTRLWTKSFVQDAYLREMYDTYEKIKKMAHTKYERTVPDGKTA